MAAQELASKTSELGAKAAELEASAAKARQLQVSLEAATEQCNELREQVQLCMKA